MLFIINLQIRELAKLRNLLKLNSYELYIKLLDIYKLKGMLFL
jgi:hypothetical protein